MSETTKLQCTIPIIPIELVLAPGQHPQTMRQGSRGFELFEAQRLPDHQMAVLSTSFGWIGSQWIRQSGYTVMIFYMDIRMDDTISVRVNEACTCFSVPFMNQLVIMQKMAFQGAALRIREKEIVGLKFEQPVTGGYMLVQKGVYLSIHVIVPAQNSQLLKNKRFIYTVLATYRELLGK